MLEHKINPAETKNKRSFKNIGDAEREEEERGRATTWNGLNEILSSHRVYESKAKFG